VVGGSAVQGTVRLAGAAPEGGLVVTLSSSASAATVPASAIVAAGASSAMFTISTVSVPDEVTASITAAVNGESRAGSLTITEIRVSRLTVFDSQVGATMETALRVELDAPASPGGTIVWLSSSHVAASVAASIVVPAGQTSAIAPIHTAQVAGGPVVVTISARAGRQTRTATVTVSPVFLSFVGQNRDWVTQGQSRRIQAGATHRFSGHYSAGHVYINATPLDPTAIDRWSLIFAAPPGEPLLPGRYVKSAPMPGPSQPVLNFSGQSRGCGSTGEFSVLTAVLSSDGTIVQFHATFQQMCESNFPAAAPTTGEIFVAMLPKF
jgi:hypothetical protein